MVGSWEITTRQPVSEGWYEDVSAENEWLCKIKRGLVWERIYGLLGIQIGYQVDEG